MAIGAAPTQASTVQSSPAVAEVKCSLCGGKRVHRVKRNGLKEKWIFSLFGYYPWRCSTCRTKFYLKRRHRSGEGRKRYAE